MMNHKVVSKRWTLTEFEPCNWPVAKLGDSCDSGTLLERCKVTLGATVLFSKLSMF